MNLTCKSRPLKIISECAESCFMQDFNNQWNTYLNTKIREWDQIYSMLAGTASGGGFILSLTVNALG